jgi:hypothetical protein
VRIPRAIAAWAGWVEEHRDASRMYFRDATALPEPVRSFHLGIHAQGRVALGAILGREQGAANIAGPGAEALEMAAEIMRAGLGGLAIWWAEHPDVPREQVVAGAVNVLWVGFERVSSRPAPRASP